MKGTIALLSICLLGVTGHIDGLTVRDAGIVAWTDVPVTMAWGGFVVFNTGFGELRPDIVNHELGHLIQEKKYGILHGVLVAIPSVLSGFISNSAEEHRARWFELEATMLGAQ